MERGSGRRSGLRGLREEAARCRRCELWQHATQTVFGEGTLRELMIVGEQPGDAEDRAGRPFVGPAGRLLRELLAEAGIGEERVYLTNAVKHFKWRPAGKRRIHDKPSREEVTACGHWLDLELATVKPRLVLCLGVTAAQALVSPSARIGALRGRTIELAGGTPALVAMHPSAVLRASKDRALRRAELLEDLALARATLDELAQPA